MHMRIQYITILTVLSCIAILYVQYCICAALCERERECACVHAYVCVRVCVCVLVCVWGGGIFATEHSTTCECVYCPGSL